MSKLGDNIRNARIAKNINQEELAKLLGKSKNVISNWERGDNRPDVDMIERLCEILDMSPNEMIGWEEEILTKQQEKEFISQKWDDETVEFMEKLHKDSNFRMLFKATKDLSAEDIKRTLDIVKVFKGDLD